MQDRKLEQALEIYFQENPDRESDKYQEIQKYLKLRIRSVMELLIENEDTEKDGADRENADGFPQMNWRIL